MNHLSHRLRLPSKPKSFHSTNWCGTVLALDPNANKVGVSYLFSYASKFEKKCDTCQNRLLHRVTGSGCRGYNVDYEEREGV